MISVRRLATRGRLVVLAAGAIILVAACGSSSNSASGTTKPANSGTPSANSPTSSTAGNAAKGVTVETHSGANGTYLTDGSGKTLYLFLADKGGKSACSGACATLWPPLTTKGAPTASGGAASGMLATITRSDGTKQVTYAGHPLYYFQQDSAAGDLNGQGINEFGALWWIVSPAGKSITKTGNAASAPSPSKSAAGSSWA